MADRIHWKKEHDKVKAELEEKLEDAATACEALRTELEESRTRSTRRCSRTSSNDATSILPSVRSAAKAESAGLIAPAGPSQ